jgi:hypothetical protein
MNILEKFSKILHWTEALSNLTYKHQILHIMAKIFLFQQFFLCVRVMNQYI